MCAFIVSLVAIVTFWLQAGFATLDDYVSTTIFFIISGVASAWAIYHGIYSYESAGDARNKAAARGALFIGVIVFIGLIASWILYSTPAKFAP